MRLCLTLICMGFSGGGAAADTVVAAQTIRAQTILTIEHLALKRGDIPGGVDDPALLVGQETRTALYAGRPIRQGDVGPPAIVERNQIVPLIFEANGLRISTEGRSLDRAGVGEYVRVMNMSSRNTVSGRVSRSGQVLVAH
ncbi:flagellar basal body P-ring biosynthesis protein FlgA [Roseovarius atlanticus]|uniref:Flagella basal body P-ring formation protein FlgA n=1 Tax=Roseovarius atlanticus TaxID=1641875 RepID=A0A0T5NRA0_9RHOB|nr:flagellar basal body P-ring formation chaperone FlgA [Roseovarius atlanticus]KRS11312.1 flagellar basal body P-ring biosynthesis protein FlgA [Roseovarius atlanticus]